MAAPTCDECGKLMEPTAALAFFYPQLRDKPQAFKWACSYCRTVTTEKEKA